MTSTSRRRSLRSWNASPSAAAAAALAATATGLLLVAFVLSVALPASAQEPPVKIGVVDLDAVVARSPAGQALQQRLQEFQQEARAGMERQQQDALALRARIEEEAGLSDADRAGLQQQLAEAQEAMQRYQSDKQREGQRMQQEGLKEIESSLEPIFAGIRDEGGYDLILNRVPGVVVMAGERLDITNLVIERLGGAR